jgi:hypothetical protein
VSLLILGDVSNFLLSLDVQNSMRVLGSGISTGIKYIPTCTMRVLASPLILYQAASSLFKIQEANYHGSCRIFVKSVQLGVLASPLISAHVANFPPFKKHGVRERLSFLHSRKQKPTTTRRIFCIITYISQREFIGTYNVNMYTGTT